MSHSTTDTADDPTVFTAHVAARPSGDDVITVRAPNIYAAVGIIAGRLRYEDYVSPDAAPRTFWASVRIRCDATGDEAHSYVPLDPPDTINTSDSTPTTTPPPEHT